MSLISLASGKSLWRGYEYYEGKRVYFHIQNGEFEYTGKVSGNGKSYNVHIDLKHPRKSTCNCPHADGKRIICKHMVALYFSIFPKEAEAYIAKVEAYELDQEEHAEEMDRKIVSCINKIPNLICSKPFTNFYAKHPSGLWTDLFMSTSTNLSFLTTCYSTVSSGVYRNSGDKMSKEYVECSRKG